jgi:hypothetical protein
MKESRFFWPLVLFPFSINHSHTLSYTGRYWLKDIKSSFRFAYIKLTESNLICRYRFFDLLIIDIPLSQIIEAQLFLDKPGLISVKFNKAVFGKIAKFALSGQPSGSKNQIILNVRDGTSWLKKLNKEHTTSHSS